MRTFQTFYTADGITGKIGDNVIEQISQLGKKVDILQSKLTEKITAITRYNMKNRIRKSIAKIKNFVNDLHHKTVSFLSKYFNVVLIPKLDVTKISQLPINIRKISSKVVRNMMTLSHGKFLELLKSKCNVMIVDESYTSKLCGNCCELNEKLGSQKIFKCSQCDYVEDRDVNGARNIMIKYLIGLGTTH